MTIYGPVRSWRLGYSLGVDPLLPPKTCTFDCVYCQLGSTRRKVDGPEDVKNYVDPQTIRKELASALKKLKQESIDYVTLSGVGEPTLYPKLKELVTNLREEVGDLKIAILTNSSLMWRNEVREALSLLDLVVAKLDAVDEETFQAINRPSPRLRISMIIDGLRRFKEEWGSDKLALQVMLIKDVNNSAEYLMKLSEIICELSPKEVQLNTVLRPPAEKWVKPLELHEMQEAASLIREYSSSNVITAYQPRQVKGELKVSVVEELELKVIDLTRRRPCRISEIASILGLRLEEAESIVKGLVADGSIVEEAYGETIFYKAKV